MSKKAVTYKDAGVDIHAGYQSVKLIKEHIKKTVTKGVVSDIGGFGGLFALDKENYESPILVSGTDGVGTKLMVAFMTDKHTTIGEDCVAMCVNDVLCQGAKPLFFLDYIATGALKPEHVASIVEGVANGCVKAGAALIGGETAEMPGLYQKGEYDVAGFSVGIVDKKNVITGSEITEGDVLIGIPSSGLHSNGFSLVRKVLFEIAGYTVDQHIEELGTTLGEELLKPTRIYINPVYNVIEEFNNKRNSPKEFAIKGISHITGGGFYENIPRMLPEGYTAKVSTANIKLQPIFDLIQKAGNVETKEMYSTFNMGIGMVMAVNKNDVDDVVSFLKDAGEECCILGNIIKGDELVVNM